MLPYYYTEKIMCRILIYYGSGDLVAKSCLTLCSPMDCSLPGSSVHGISQARILEWVAISFSRGTSQARDRTYISCIGRQTLYHCTTKEAQISFFLKKTSLHQEPSSRKRKRGGGYWHERHLTPVLQKVQ